MSNLMALLLQGLSARLGIVRGRDLAQANREAYPRYVNLALYLLAEIAIAACDLAEVLGMAIGIQLLTGLPLDLGRFHYGAGYLPFTIPSKIGDA
jgi:manganese transport protein